MEKLDSGKDNNEGKIMKMSSLKEFMFSHIGICEFFIDSSEFFLYS